MKVYVVYWWDDCCPEHDGCYIGIGSTGEEAEKLGDDYLKRQLNRLEPAGRFVVREMELDKLQLF